MREIRFRGGRPSAFSRRRVGPSGLPQLRLRTVWLRLRRYGSALQLRGSGHGRNDHYYRDASSDLHSAAGCLRILQLRAQLLGRIPAWPSRVLVALKTRVSQIHWRTLRNAGTTERAREVRFDSVDGRFYYGHVVA